MSEEKPKFEVCHSFVDDAFFNQYKKELKELYGCEFKVTTSSVANEIRKTSVLADCGAGSSIRFTIMPFPSNCGALVSNNISVNVYRHGDKYEKGMKIVDTCITRCMEFLSRTALYYTVTENQPELRDALEKCGWVKLGRDWTNKNSDNRITTLLKLR